MSYNCDYFVNLNFKIKVDESSYDYNSIFVQKYFFAGQVDKDSVNFVFEPIRPYKQDLEIQYNYPMGDDYAYAYNLFS